MVVTGNSNALNAVTSALARNQIVARQLRVDQANLEDAFLALTGQHAPEKQGAVRMPGISTAITATAPQTRTARSSGLLKLTATELKLLSRERVRAVLPIAIPLLLIIILGNIASLRQPRAIYGGESFIDLYTTIMVVLGLALLALTNMPMMLADYRERGRPARGCRPRRSARSGSWPRSSRPTSPSRWSWWS